MNQGNVGKFIQECRKEKGLTQLQLAEQLNITDRAVSKWENGRSLPDVGIMEDLCAILNISVNELLSGKRVAVENYKQEADANLLALHRKEEIANKRLLSIETLSLISMVLITTAVTYLYDREMIQKPYGLLLMILTFGITAILVLVNLNVEREAGYYRCSHCEKSFIPSINAYLLAPHLGFSRFMKCPHCGKYGLDKKILTEKE